jgi:hypothetical protein
MMMNLPALPVPGKTRGPAFTRGSGLFFLCLLFLAACGYKSPALTLSGAEPGTVLIARSRAAASGVLSPGGSRRLEYVFDKPLAVPPDMSLELDYTVRFNAAPAAAGEGQLLCTIEDVSWALPLDARFLGMEGAPGSFRYALPLTGPEIRGISVSLEGGTPGTVTLRSLNLVPRWYGFERRPGSGGETSLAASPFVFRDGPSLTIDPPEQYRIRGEAEIAAAGLGDKAVLAAGKIEYVLSGGTAPQEIAVPAGAVPPEPYPLVCTGVPAVSLKLSAALAPAFPQPIPADPGIILSYPQSFWRDRRYELFRWDRFPSILIFDTAGYEIQERFFKRLAFFVEKKGFRGRLVPDAELASLHGWNAHDYRAEDLARFFDAAGKADFPLTPEERELREILLRAGIIRDGGNAGGGIDTGGVIPGEGAVISISRESSEYLRSLFMPHEAFHGLFFIDEDFRAFSQERWDNLSPGARRFIISFFDYQQYDINDPYLMVNELMGYCLQQPPSQAGEYFGKTQAGRLASTWRSAALPARDSASGTWPEIARAFAEEAEAFSSYTDRRWGLSGGRAGRLTARTRR